MKSRAVAKSLRYFCIGVRWLLWQPLLSRTLGRAESIGTAHLFLHSADCSCLQQQADGSKKGGWFFPEKKQMFILSTSLFSDTETGCLLLWKEAECTSPGCMGCFSMHSIATWSQAAHGRWHPFTDVSHVNSSSRVSFCHTFVSCWMSVSFTGSASPTHSISYEHP